MAARIDFFRKLLEQKGFEKKPIFNYSSACSGVSAVKDLLQFQVRFTHHRVIDQILSGVVENDVAVLENVPAIGNR